jgi:hypothetical protein
MMLLFRNKYIWFDLIWCPCPHPCPCLCPNHCPGPLPCPSPCPTPLSTIVRVHVHVRWTWKQTCLCPCSFSCSCCRNMKMDMTRYGQKHGHGFTLPSKTFMHWTRLTTVFSIKYESDIIILWPGKTKKAEDRFPAILEGCLSFKACSETFFHVYWPHSESSQWVVWYWLVGSISRPGRFGFL